MWPAYVDHKVKISRNKMKLLCIKRWSALQRASNWRLVWIWTTTDAFICSISFPLYLHSFKTKNDEIWSLNYAKYWWSQKIQFMRRFLATTKQEKLLLRIKGLVRIGFEGRSHSKSFCFVKFTHNWHFETKLCYSPTGENQEIKKYILWKYIS